MVIMLPDPIRIVKPYPSPVICCCHAVLSATPLAGAQSYAIIPIPAVKLEHPFMPGTTLHGLSVLTEA